MTKSDPFDALYSTGAAETILKAAVNNVHDADIMTDDWTYYVYIVLTLLPAYLFFKLWMWIGWQLYVNN